MASWSVGALAVGQSATLTVLVQATARGHVAAPAALVHSTQIDSTDLNNVDSVAVEESADLEITTDVTPDIAEPGEVVTTTVTVTNLWRPGWSYRRGHEHRATSRAGCVGHQHVPSEVSLVDVATTVGSYDPVTGVWLIGGLIPGEIQTLRIPATASWSGDGGIRR